MKRKRSSSEACKRMSFSAEKITELAMQIDKEESEMGPNRRHSQDALVNSSIERSGTVLFDHSN